VSAKIPEWSTGGDWVEFSHGGRKWRALVSAVNHAEEPRATEADIQRRAAASYVVAALNHAAPKEST